MLALVPVRPPRGAGASRCERNPAPRDRRPRSSRSCCCFAPPEETDVVPRRLVGHARTAAGPGRGRGHRALAHARRGRPFAAAARADDAPARRHRALQSRAVSLTAFRTTFAMWRRSSCSRRWRSTSTCVRAGAIPGLLVALLRRVRRVSSEHDAAAEHGHRVPTSLGDGAACLAAWRA